MRISDWSSDVCSSDLGAGEAINVAVFHRARLHGTRIAADIGFGEREAGDDLTARDPGQPCGLLRVGARHHEPLAADPDIGAEGRSEGGRGAAEFDGDVRLLGPRQPQRSEEHTYELQSLMRISYAVFC